MSVVRTRGERDAVRPVRRGWTLVLGGLGAFLCSLDVVVVATALPTLRKELGATLSDLEWTINGYNLAFACLMLTGAALGDRFGRRRVYVLGLGVFVAASAACASSSDVGELIAARVVEGAGAAVLLPLTLTLISDAFPAGERGAAIGLWGGVTGLGVAGGPVLGGAITEGLAWQWIFWINVPVGLVMIPLSARLLRESRGPRPQLDLVGLVLAALGMLALTWAPVRAPVVGWGSPEVVTAFVTGGLVLLGFLAWERRVLHPMLPMEYFRSPGFSVANVVIFFQFLSLLGALFMITQLFQTGLGNSPYEAGLRLLVWTAMPMLVAPLSGVLADRVGTRPFMLGGLVLQAVGLGWLAAVADPGVGYASLVPPLVVAGTGIGMIFATTASAATAAVPVDDTGVAAGTNTALRELGGVFGVAILSAVFAHNGGYASTTAFFDGVTAALWVAAAAPLAGVAAVLTVERALPGR
ncbi:EmrB/QacA subfamily drug resistance transporter [Streptomyces tendae]|uniref:MFS transporter n=1 Tax=Streptomyces tendae TaxID=1932 RepID=UPI00383987C3